MKFLVGSMAGLALVIFTFAITAAPAVMARACPLSSIVRV